MLFKLSNLNSNLAVTPGYFNPELNNSALSFIPIEMLHFRKYPSFERSNR